MARSRPQPAVVYSYLPVGFIKFCLYFWSIFVTFFPFWKMFCLDFKESQKCLI